MKTYLSKKGYVLKKSEFSKEVLNKTKSELTVIPLLNDTFVNVNREFDIFLETINNLYVPKMYGIKNFGLPARNSNTYNGIIWKSQHIFTGTLLDRQITPFNKLLNACHTKGGGLLQLNAGAGKTFITIKVLSELKSKTIIIVNKIPLMNQWAYEISQLLPTIKIGYIQGQGNISVCDCDIVIAMLQSMSRIDYPDELFHDFRVAIFDEVHNFSSKCFSKILFKVCCPYSIALSATPQRSDSCDYVINYHVGDLVYKGSVERIGLPPKLHIVKLSSIEYKEIISFNNFKKKDILQYTSMISHLISMQNRNNIIIKYIHEYILQNRKILILSDRRDHLYTLQEILQNTNVDFTFGLFLGKMKQKELEQTKKCNVLLATYKAFSEGINEKELDTLFLITPKKYIGHLHNTIKKDNGSLEQIVGRIFRKKHVDIQPVIVDFFDNFSVYKNHGYSRQVFYKQHFENLEIVETKYNLDNDIQTTIYKSNTDTINDSVCMLE
jgi:superfamily II DNA or RNA helicase